ncbi:MAG TPA: SDR family oxidoreductase [Candidatus Elarobacter sp.]|nr:SDR family oxidoreductase [Candidatus Elarobacter sp.]
MDLGLTGKVVVVLAASKGLGRACAETFADEGALIAIGSRDRERLEQTASEIAAAGVDRRVLAVPVDVTDAHQSRAFIDAVVHEFGRIDILVNNAGGPPFGSFDAFDDEAWRAAFELNLLSTVRMTRLALPHMPRGAHGRIINVTSMSVKSFLPGSMLSTAIRSGVIGMAKMLADEVGPHGITVNNVAPGLILTDRLRETGVGHRADQAPLRRAGEPSEFAAVVAFLASERASYVTGTTIPVDGGLIRAIG